MTKITRELVVEKLPKRPRDSHKGTFGSSLIIAGSKNYPGAAILSVLAAARSGVGLVTLATTPEVYKIIVPKIPFATFLRFSEIEDNIKKYDSILIGPGLKIEDLRFKIKVWMSLGEFRNKKLVIDAEVLNLFSEMKDWFKIWEQDAILTPHPGEMSRLTKLPIEEIQKNRQGIIKNYSKIWNKIVILKGSETLIANPKGQIYQSEFANPLLATAGAGDVLAGIITGFLAQGLSLLDASISGVYIQGLCGEKLKEKFNDRGATSLDLVEVLPEVFNSLSRQPS